MAELSHTISPVFLFNINYFNDCSIVANKFAYFFSRITNMMTYLSGIILYFKEVNYQTFCFVCLTPFLKQISHTISSAIIARDTIITGSSPCYRTLFTIILV